ncbi:MAG: hypothetical protein ABI452_01670 [Candidatus Limnocylindrales bacterium]
MSNRIQVALGAAATATIVVAGVLSLPRSSTGPAAAAPASTPGQKSSFAIDASPPVTSSAPTNSPPPDAMGACGLYVDQVDRVLGFYTVEGVSEFSEAVVAGDVVAIGKAQWATKDGGVPADEFGIHPSADDVYRVVDVHVDGIGMQSDARPVSVGNVLHVRILGGSIGCRKYVFSDDEDFIVGDQIVVFLGTQPTLSAVPYQGFDAVSVWRAQDGSVQSRDGLLSVNDVLQLSASYGE